MKTIFFQELKSNRKSILLWCFSMALLAVFFLAIYPAFSTGAEEFKKLMAGFPPAMLKAFSFDVELIFSPMGYYALIFSYMTLCGGIYAMILGTQVIVKEFNHKTADFLFTKPVSRIHIIAGKLVSGVLSVAVTDILAIGLTYLAALMIFGEPLESISFMRVSATLFLISLLFYVLGFLIGAIFQRIKSVIGVSIGTVFGFYVTGLLGSALDDEKLKYLVPFQFYDPMKIIREASYETYSIIATLVFVLTGLLASTLILAKRDIHV